MARLLTCGPNPATWNQFMSSSRQNVYWILVYLTSFRRRLHTHRRIATTRSIDELILHQQHPPTHTLTDSSGLGELEP